MSANVLTESRTPAVEAIPSDPQPEISLEDIWNGIAQDQFFPHFSPKSPCVVCNSWASKH